MHIDILFIQKIQLIFYHICARLFYHFFHFLHINTFPPHTSQIIWE